MNLKTLLALVATSGLIIACTQIPTAEADAPAAAKPRFSLGGEDHEEAKERVLREGGYDGIKGINGEDCRRICVVEPNAISCRQALEDEECTTRAEEARKKLGLPVREHNPLPMPMRDIKTASRSGSVTN